MSLLAIEKSRCKRDRLCIEICPFGIIGADADGYPRANPDMETMCMNCGQCMSACPQGAFSLTAMPRERCEPIAERLPVPAVQAVQLLKRRRSIRRYKPAPVPRPLLEQVLDVARWAPTAKNIQPVQYLVIESPAEVKRLAGMTVEWMRGTGLFSHMVAAWDKGVDAVLRGAPHLVVAHAPAEGFKPVVDCTIALVYVDLAASAHGLGCCWAGVLMAAIDACKPVAEALQLPAGHKACGALMLGYPRSRYYLVPQRKPLHVTWR